jgi:hypothetical protein
VELEISARAYDSQDKSEGEVTKTLEANLKPESFTQISS